ncbi:MAG TPA: hypothetical protein VM427_06070 [Patescibacteria group bacterium]|nr:hypothetical protein [Patescibacteria group bacterium]
MTADRRLRIGGWAALLVAIVAPLRIVALWTAVGSTGTAGAGDPWATQPYLIVDLVRIVGVLVAIVGLDGLFGSFEPSSARMLLVVGGVGAGLGLAADVTTAAGLRPSVLETVLVLAGDVLIAAWFIGGGLVLVRAGRQWARVGWTACLGGIGQVLAAGSAAVGFGGPVGVTGTSLIDWFLLIGLFVVIYLVRVWRFVVGGRMPGPGLV